MTKEDIIKALENAVKDEGEAVKAYQELAIGFQAWVLTLPFSGQRDEYQLMVNNTRFILSDETRHRGDFQRMIAKLAP
ncbi:MAG: hypothetical protein KJ624_08305 [Chloroflexi bacterium]|nr:hypothetical protein [Chloroflexota bacterium]